MERLSAAVVRVLVVEDNPGDERLIRMGLADDHHQRFEVSSCRSLFDAVRAVHASHFDAVLLDLSLPDASGLTGLKQLALAVPRTPILVLTGLDDGRLAIEACHHGGQDYLVKGRSDVAVLGRAICCAIARKRFEAILAERAHFDSLTGLVNRGLFQDRLTHAIGRAQRGDNRVAVLFVDLDRFKIVNDSLGHHVGDRVLQGVARVLRNSVRQTDTVARWGGDEFTILLEPIDDLHDVERVAEKIRVTLDEPISVAEGTLLVTASIGTAVFPDDGTRSDILLERADATMFVAKNNRAKRRL